MLAKLVDLHFEHSVLALDVLLLAGNLLALKNIPDIPLLHKPFKKIDKGLVLNEILMACDLKDLEDRGISMKFVLVILEKLTQPLVDEGIMAAALEGNLSAFVMSEQFHGFGQYVPNDVLRVPWIDLFALFLFAIFLNLSLALDWGVLLSSIGVIVGGFLVLHFCFLKLELHNLILKKCILIQALLVKSKVHLGAL